MDTALVNSASMTTSTSQTKTASKEMDKNAFLMLLVAQLQNQDPTQAQDSNQMMQQMTSFSSLEQMQNTNKLLEGIQLQNQGLFQAQSSSLVGKRIRVNSSGFDLKEGKASMGVDLSANALVTITIKDAAGNVVATIEKGSLNAGTHVMEWDGRNAQGNRLADGAYSVEISAKDTAGNAVTATPSAYVTVDSVLFSNGTVYILAGGRRFMLSDVNEISA
jgi:flagellar basal-body rod modification protein FlgD